MNIKYSRILLLVFIAACNVSGLDVGLAKPNIVLIMTDDQDVILDGMFPMQRVQKFLGDEGATFLNAFTTSPICCPSRASILSGMYAHNHKTTNNSVSGGCYGDYWQRKVEPSTLPVVLQSNGYETFFAGKYLNEFQGQKVPPGWSHFHGLHGNSKYYNYTLNENGKNVSYQNEYLTDVLTQKALKFLEKPRTLNQPFFAMITPPAPHAPYTPAERHQGIFADVQALKTPNFNTESGSLDKHWLVASSKKISNKTLSLMDEYFRKRWESLLAVDEMVEELITKLTKANLLRNTYVIYTSDNGYHIGQFAQPFDKRQPYETDIRVPLMIRGPQVPPGIKISAPVALIDIFPTILEWTNLPLNDKLDGLSFNVFMQNSLYYDALLDPKFRRGILIQYWGEGNDNTYNPQCPQRKSDHLNQCTLEAECHCQDSWNNTYGCVRHFRHQVDRLYCEFKDNENFVEAYDLQEDPFQMTNVGYTLLPIELAIYSLALSNLTHCSGASCNDIMI